MSVDIRVATIDDAEAIARVHVHAWDESYRGLVPDDVIDARTVSVRMQHWEKTLARRDCMTLLARHEGNLVGFACVILFDPPIEGFPAYLRALYVLECAKGKGVGRLLLAAFANRLHSTGRTKLILRTLRLNPQSRGFYEHLGARLISEGSSIEAGLYDDVVYAFDDLGVLCQPHDAAEARRRGTSPE